ncbi:MAG: pyruvate kinase alpha/beta domain-containing protein [Dehalococcoidales bacterium]|nr:pyruvate kinase alpha/beta domain-containing protein [Dehalococcoidales bacterium]MDZ4247127.1 pyruvate kinase alpha/beta domain-containing protein [Dehalococcoidia bacterium]
MERKIVYFENAGSENTEAVLLIAKERADELGIRTILVASTSGRTAARAVEVFEGKKVVAVGHPTGWRQPNVNSFTEENRQKVESRGGKVLLVRFAFQRLGGSGPRLSAHEGVSQPVSQAPVSNDTAVIVNRTLRLFGAGMKVACEITIIAADAGLARTDEDVIVISGTNGGSDTAVMLRPVNTWDFFRLRIKEILCKPKT